LARDTAEALTRAGFAVITGGGGPGGPDPWRGRRHRHRRGRSWSSVAAVAAWHVYLSAQSSARARRATPGQAHARRHQA
jgi:hypothetical protein